MELTEQHLPHDAPDVVRVRLLRLKADSERILGSKWFAETFRNDNYRFEPSACCTEIDGAVKRAGKSKSVWIRETLIKGARATK